MAIELFRKTGAERSGMGWCFACKTWVLMDNHRSPEIVNRQVVFVDCGPVEEYGKPEPQRYWRRNLGGKSSQPLLLRRGQ